MRYSLPGGDAQHAHLDVRSVTIEKDGPCRVTGIPLEGARLATGANSEKSVLCRCGASKNKPFCDEAHYDIEWTAS